MGRAVSQPGSELRRTIDISIGEGLFSQIYAGLAGPGSVFVTKLAYHLGAGPMQFSVLSAIGMVSQVFQPLGLAITRSLTARKRAVIALAAAGRAMTPLYGLLPLLLPRRDALDAFLLLFFAVTSVLAVGTNAWMGWIGDMVPTRFRGRFFARRNQVLMLVGLVSGFVFSAAIDLFDSEPGPVASWMSGILGLPPMAGRAGTAFLVLFCLAGVIGLSGLAILARQPERSKVVETATWGSMMAKPLRDPDFRRLAVWGVWWLMALGIGAPFWQPFMIGELGMSVLMIMLYGTISTVAGLLSLRAWGRFIDRYGNKNAMRCAIVMAAMNPLFWVAASRSRIFLIYGEAFVSGITWAGAGIVMTNFVLSVAPKQEQQAWSGMFSALTGLAMMVTALASGALMPGSVSLLGMDLHPMQVLFLVGSAARLTALIPLSGVREQSVPFTAVVRRIQQFAAVRVLNLTAIIHPRR